MQTTSQSTVLIVDDEPLGRETLEALLEPMGYSLVSAASGQETLDRASEVLPDLILLDVMMPGMDGYEVCQKLRSDEKLAEVPIIMVTSLSDRESRLQALEIGADDYLTKPIDRMQLRARVRTTTRLNRYRRLMNERAKFQSIAEESGEGFLILDRNCRICYANLKAREMMSIPGQIQETNKPPFFNSIAENFRLEPSEHWQAWCEEGGLPEHRPLFLVSPETPRSEGFWLQVDVIELPDGNMDEMLVRIRDVTSEVAGRFEIGRFHNYVSHKLRTPLNGLTGCVEVLAHSAGSMDRKQITDLATIGLNSLQRLERDIEHVLSFMQSGSTSRREAPLRLDGLEKQVRQIADSIGVKQVKFEMANPLYSRSVQLGESHLSLIFSELLSNALKFHPSRNPSMSIRLMPMGDRHCRITIEDNGVSLTPTHYRMAWMPYYQCERHFTGEVEGMGLGLPTIATLIWNFGGTFRMGTREDGNEGTCVELTVPVAGSIFEEVTPH